MQSNAVQKFAVEVEAEHAAPRQPAPVILLRPTTREQTETQGQETSGLERIAAGLFVLATVAINGWLLSILYNALQNYRVF